MARPQKSNADYYPMDVNFLGNKKIKLLKSEFGLNCIVVIIAMFENIYGRDGYFLKWDDDECLLMSDGVGGGCTPNYIREVLKGCIRRSLFDEGVFNMFGVITSKGIQKRYIRIFENRSEIRMIKEYFLLDTTDNDDIPDWILSKLILKSVSEEKNVDKKEINPDKKENNPQSKEKKNKVKKITVCEPPTLEEVERYCNEKSYDIDAKSFIDFFTESGWIDSKGNPVLNWKQKIITWAGGRKKSDNFSSDNMKSGQKKQVETIY